MNIFTKKSVLGCSVAAIAVAVCVSSFATAAPGGIAGAWRVVEWEDDNGTIHVTPSSVEKTRSFDTAGQTMTTEVAIDDIPSSAFTMSYSVNANGELEFTDGAGLTIVMSCVVSGNTLTMTTVSHVGALGCPAPDEPYADGSPVGGPTVMPPMPVASIKMTRN